jgi:hypothetical protein
MKYINMTLEAVAILVSGMTLDKRTTAAVEILYEAASIYQYERKQISYRAESLIEAAQRIGCGREPTCDIVRTAYELEAARVRQNEAQRRFEAVARASGVGIIEEESS